MSLDEAALDEVVLDLRVLNSEFKKIFKGIFRSVFIQEKKIDGGIFFIFAIALIQSCLRVLRQNLSYTTC